MKKITLSILLIFSVTFINAQSSWKKIDSKNYDAKTELIQRKNSPKNYTLYNLSITNFKNELASKSNNNSNTIQLPTANGNMQRFSVTETSNFEKGLAEKFTEIKSYTATGVDDLTATAKISIGTDGVHAVIFSANHSSFYIDPYTKNKTTYIAYKRDKLDKKHDFECLSKDEKNDLKSTKKTHDSQRDVNDQKLRTYRLAVVTSAEYSQFHLNQQNVSPTATDTQKKNAILSAINTTITRVNGVYERDLAVKMVLVADNDKIVYLDTNTDGISDVNEDQIANTLINQSQTICDAQIGNANYDIGHIFTINGSGLAGVGVVCIQGQKGRGVTGRSQPIGDPYDIDYVAHEIGHQFGARHTQNNSCNRQDNNSVEPGSGSTIMGYAGICRPNVQNSSDDYFHTVSIAQMWNIIQSTASCASITNTNNPAPTVDAGNSVYGVPKSTPLVLRGQATDTNSNTLTYCWEQIDPEVATMAPLSTNTAGPMFRSLPPNSSPDRYLPRLSTVINGNTSSMWEVLPSVARDMNFALTVRDNNPNGGASARDDLRITVADMDPFTVTAPNTNVTWNSGSQQTITWNVSKTNEAPVYCTNVRIKLSLDGGLTFPITLIENTSNDGEHKIIVPNNPTSNARIMVEAIDNVFYNVNSTNFVIDSAQATFVFNNTSEDKTVCKSSSETVNYTFSVDFINGFSETVTFNATNTPPGSSVSFSPTSLTSSGNVTMSLSNFNSANNQEYTMNITGSSNSVSQPADAIIGILDDSFGNIILNEPINNIQDIELSPTLKWGNDNNATEYLVQISTDQAFSNIIETGTVKINSYKVVTPLNTFTTYYWNVKPKNACGEGETSSIASFKTACIACTSNGSTTFDTSTTRVTFNTINNGSAKPEGYNDYTQISTTVKRGDVHNLSVSVNTDSDADNQYRVQTKAWIDWNGNCVFDANEEYDLGFASGVANGATSSSPLAITVPNDAVFGSHTMRISTRYTDPDPISYPIPCETGFDGEVEDYTIVVEDDAASIEDFTFGTFKLYPNPSQGRFNLSFEVLNTDKVSVNLFDIRGRLIENKTFKNTPTIFNEELVFDRVNSGLYLLQISNGNKQTTRKIIIK